MQKEWLTCEDGLIDKVSADKGGGYASQKQLLDFLHLAELPDSIHQGEENKEKKGEVKHLVLPIISTI